MRKSLVAWAVLQLGGCGSTGDGAAVEALVEGETPAATTPVPEGSAPTGVEGATTDTNSGLLPGVGGGAPQLPPEAVVRAYLERGSRREDVVDLVHPLCINDASVSQIEAIRVMGIPMTTLASLSVVQESLDANRATVRYAARGAAVGDNGETEVGGALVPVAHVDVPDAARDGIITLARDGSRWTISCAALGTVPTNTLEGLAPGTPTVGSDAIAPGSSAAASAAAPSPAAPALPAAGPSAR